MTDRLFIVTLSEIDGPTAEFLRLDTSIGAVAVYMVDLRMRVRAIEEIPRHTYPLPAPWFSEATVGQTRGFYIHGREDENVFQAEQFEST